MTETNAMLNKQYPNEMKNSLRYSMIANLFKKKGFKFLYELFYLQAIEEQSHANKILAYISARPDFEFYPIFEFAVKDLDSDRKFLNNEKISALDIFKFTYEAEVETTRNLNGIAEIARKERDERTSSWLYNGQPIDGKGLIPEQLEEEDTFGTFVHMLETLSEVTEGERYQFADEHANKIVSEWKSEGIEEDD